MGLVASVLVGLVALLHFYILVLEMFLWTTPKGRKAFGLTPEFAEASKVLAANQGLYNGFLGAGLAWGLVLREPDPQDRRARRIRFTPTGLDWLAAFQDAIERAEAEARTELGEDVLTVVRLGLEAYATSPD
jgi:uncharacterized membrane protein